MAKNNQKDDGIAKWKTREKELLNEIKILQKRNDDMSRTIKLKEQLVEKLKHVESKHTEEIKNLTVKLKEKSIAAKEDAKARADENQKNNNSPRGKKADEVKCKAASMDHLHTLTKQGSMDSEAESMPDIKRGIQPFQRSHSMKEGNINLPEYCMHAFRCEKWVGESGSKLQLPNVNVVIPSKSVESGTKVLISATKIDISRDIVHNIALVKLQHMAQPLVQLYFEPQGMRFSKEVYLEILGAKNSPQYRYLVFQKDVNHFETTQWTEVTNESKPLFQKGSVLRILLQQFSATVILRLDVPVTSFVAMNGVSMGYTLGPISQPTNTPRAYYGGVNTEVMTSILNGEVKKLEFNVYHDTRSKSLNVWAKEIVKKKGQLRQQASGDVEQVNNNHDLETSKHIFLNKLSGKFPLCNKDRIYFHFDSHKKWQHMGIIEFEEVTTHKGQLFKVALNVKKSGGPGVPVIHMEKLPKNLSITRRVADRLDEQMLCELDLIECSFSNNYAEESITHEMIDRVLSRVRIRIIRTVDVKYLVDVMRKNDIFTMVERDEIVNERTPYTRAKMFMDRLVRKGPRGMVAFCQALETNYVGLAHEIRAILQCSA